ncbi:hypothetical protein AC73_2243 [Escherichia coli 2-427-07_S4_C1]|uniref:Uncharacterized protein n=1 Tax=Escherichia coli 2-460-02_S1_C1 TaxID=1444044 RepID=A0A836NCA6_ECOLX|nr:hypothetical protein EC174750_2056 [Escherichia coli 174750]KDT19334.1 hypothetical protein AB84_2240 [Escherichia coli 2-052-05_S3_C1]KDU35961.1 hypothetical protein AC86_3497 [Escherichia coli 3-073-06_S4_C1]KDV83679.1 hypothetical protein AC42_2197 [Escherichia coli 2-052-05_S3_C3]KDY45111.1 hypothetical protein AC73_2243 [Escherichia coli 2-427-07_S4_C1]KEJ46706.1 hypothetical protein AD31_2478 [Escherichia coli 2-427-07_S4_C3]KEJ60970.1 hypothetical protein AC88_2445 [Escherichia coli
MRKRVLSVILLFLFKPVGTVINRAIKKPPEGDLPGAFSCVHAPLEDLNVFQHTSPERLVRMMVMMVVFKLNACHKSLCECLFN